MIVTHAVRNVFHHAANTQEDFQQHRQLRLQDVHWQMKLLLLETLSDFLVRNASHVFVLHLQSCLVSSQNAP